MMYFLLTHPDEIPTSNWSSTLDMLGQFFWLATVFILIIFLSIYVLRIGSKFRNYTGGNSNLRIIESRSLGTNNYIHLVKIGNKYIVVGSSKENVTFLTEADKESIVDVFDSPKTSKFEEQLSKHIQKMFRKEIPPEE